MRSEGFPKRFCFKRWVEGPLEGMMDLSADAEAYRHRAERILALGTGAALAFLLVLVGMLVLDTIRIIFPFLSSAGVLPQHMPMHLSIMAITVIFMALAFFSTLLLVQVWRYMTVMLKRFESVEDLLGNPPEKPSDRKVAPEMKMPGVALFNILGASSFFTTDILRNMPQVCRQMRFLRTVLMLMPLYYVSLKLLLPLAFGVPMLPEMTWPEALFEAGLIALSVLSVVAGLLILEAGRFMEALNAGLILVDSVKNAPLPKVLGVGTSAERLDKYLEGKIEGCKPVQGLEGYAIHLASDECLVLAIHTGTAPDLKLVKEFMQNCRKELEKTKKLPCQGRFIILYTPENEADDIGEDVEKHILANPITLGIGPGGGNTETVIQIMVEEDGAYSMFPFVG